MSAEDDFHTCVPGCLMKNPHRAKIDCWTQEQKDHRAANLRTLDDLTANAVQRFKVFFVWRRWRTDYTPGDRRDEIDSVWTTRKGALSRAALVEGQIVEGEHEATWSAEVEERMLYAGLIDLYKTASPDTPMT